MVRVRSERERAEDKEQTKSQNTVGVALSIRDSLYAIKYTFNHNRRVQSKPNMMHAQKGLWACMFTALLQYHTAFPLGQSLWLSRNQPTKSASSSQERCINLAVTIHVESPQMHTTTSCTYYVHAHTTNQDTLTAAFPL